jgi:hypothetical protein
MALQTQNPFVGIVDRSYRQMKTAIIEKLRDPINGIPEITDDSESNDYIKTVSVWCGLIEIFGLWLDDKSEDTFLSTVKRFINAVYLSRQWDYRIRSYVAASGTVTFTANNPAPSDITIPQGTELESTDGTLKFTTLADAIITTGNTTVDADVKQYHAVASSVIGTSDGSQDQTIQVDGKIADGSVQIVVGISDVFATVDTLLFSLPTEKHFVAGINENEKMEIRFGDGINGEIPTNGSDINAVWFLTDGADGNVGSGQITTIVDSLTLPPGIQLKVNNTAAFTGGADIQSIAEIRKSIQWWRRTKNRCVNIQDFVDVATLYPGVALAGAQNTCGKTIDIFIVPDGGGTASDTLINETQSYVDERKVIGTSPTVRSAGEIVMSYKAAINALPNFFNNTVKTNLENNFIEFHALENQSLSPEIHIGDIYELIENTNGVKNSIFRYSEILAA